MLSNRDIGLLRARKKTEEKKEKKKRRKNPPPLPSCLHARSVILSYPGGLISRGLCTSLREGWHQVNPSPRNVFHEEKCEQDDSDGVLGLFFLPARSRPPLFLSLSLYLYIYIYSSLPLYRRFKSPCLLRGTYSREIISREHSTEYAKIKIRTRMAR